MKLPQAQNEEQEAKEEEEKKQQTDRKESSLQKSVESRLKRILRGFKRLGGWTDEDQLLPSAAEMPKLWRPYSSTKTSVEQNLNFKFHEFVPNDKSERRRKRRSKVWQRSTKEAENTIAMQKCKQK